MKNFKKVLSFALALLMVVGCMVVAPVDAKADEGTYAKVTSVNEISEAGSYVIIGSNTDKNNVTTYYAMGTSLHSKGYLYAVEVVLDGNSITSSSAIPVWTITPVTNGFTVENSSGYLNAVSGKTISYVSEVTNSATWALTDSENGIVMQSTAYDAADDGLMAFNYNNGSTPRYKTYANNTSCQTELMFYKVNGTTTDPDDENNDNTDNTDNTPTLSTSNLDVPANATQAEIVDLAYTLGEGYKLTSEVTLTGVVKSIDAEYSEQFGNITVTIQVGDKADKLIQCYRLSGTGVADIAVNDEITVKGTIKNYYGKVEFDQGCSLVTDESNALPEGATQAEIVAAAYDLAAGTSLDGTYTLKGIISKIDTAYDDYYKNVTVTIVVDNMTDYPIQCFRLKGTGADVIAAGDEITVTGTLMNYGGTIEFNSGCTLDAYVDNTPDNDDEDDSTSETGSESSSETESSTGSETEATLSAAEIMALAEALKDGESLEGTYTLTGKVLEVSEVSSYGDVNVTLEVDGTDGKTIYCYGVKGDGNTDIKVGDKITVTGTIKNYKDTVEFYLPQFIPAKGDMSSMAVYMILLAGAALVVVGAVSKRKMA